MGRQPTGTGMAWAPADARQVAAGPGQQVVGVGLRVVLGQAFLVSLANHQAGHRRTAGCESPAGRRPGAGHRPPAHCSAAGEAGESSGSPRPGLSACGTLISGQARQPGSVRASGHHHKVKVPGMPAPVFREQTLPSPSRSKPMTSTFRSVSHSPFPVRRRRQASTTIGWFHLAFVGAVFGGRPPGLVPGTVPADSTRRRH